VYYEFAGKTTTTTTTLRPIASRQQDAIRHEQSASVMSLPGSYRTRGERQWSWQFIIVQRHRHGFTLYGCIA